jgi:outer membrane protein OmpA-like peptidoglycan-associated protein
MAASREGSGLETSMTDLMTSLAVIFILLLVASLNNIGEGPRPEILKRLNDALQHYAKDGVVVQQDPKDPLTLMVLVPESLLGFNLDSSKLPPRGAMFLNSFAPELFGVACGDFRDQISSVVVEGHTDHTGTEARNLPLSQERSMAVVQKSLTVVSDTDRHACMLNLISASGRGSADPYVPETSSGGEGRNRRVVFKIRVKSIEQRRTSEQR